MIDLAGPENEITKALHGTDVVISTIYGGSVMDEVPLINAAKAAGVQRYLPCFFATVAPPKGALLLREMVIYGTEIMQIIILISSHRKRMC